LGKSPDIKMLSSKLGIPEDEVEMTAQLSQREKIIQAERILADEP
jgi:hypothetical protein